MYKRKETIGDATLYLGCCEAAMAEMTKNQFELAIVDPNYGRGEHGGTSRNTKVKQKNGSTIVAFDGGYANKGWDKNPATPEYLERLEHVSAEQIVWGVNYYNHPMTGGRIVWDKVNDGSDQSDCEIAYCSHNEKVSLLRYMWRGMMQGKSLAEGMTQQGDKSLNEKRIHPTQKPVRLYNWILLNYAKEGDHILDTHGGSMSSVIACLDMGFKIDCYEIDEDYFDAGCRRVEEHVKQLRLF